MNVVLSTCDIAKMMDLSCVQVHYRKKDFEKLVCTAKAYQCGQISVLQAFIDDCKLMLSDRNDIKLIGNVSFPSGSDSTELKLIQARQMVQQGCDEIDMVININWMKSGMYSHVQHEIEMVRKVIGLLPLKVIIEVSCLTDPEIKTASTMCVEAGASYIKTGTGWKGPTTLEHVRLIKATVGDSVPIKVSGGIKTLDVLLRMYQAGATRFGVNLEGGIHILEESVLRNMSRS